MSAARLLPWLALAASGCAAVIPAATFGSSTPSARTDLALGGAMRIARGDARAASHPAPEPTAYHRSVNALGVVPMVSARYGLSESTDLGIVASGTGVRLDLRRERVLRQGSTRVQLLYGVGAAYSFVPAADRDQGQAHLAELVPVASLGVDFGGLYEAWTGPRLTLGGLFGEYTDMTAGNGSLRAFRTDLGWTLGFAAGLRRVHVFAELTAAAQLTRGSLGAVTVDTTGLVLLPAFGLRVRL